MHNHQPNEGTRCWRLQGRKRPVVKISSAPRRWRRRIAKILFSLLNPTLFLYNCYAYVALLLLFTSPLLVVVGRRNKKLLMITRNQNYIYLFFANTTKDINLNKQQPPIRNCIFITFDARFDGRLQIYSKIDFLLSLHSFSRIGGLV